VTSGSNGYRALVGYDPVTGLGTPNATLVTDLVSHVGQTALSFTSTATTTQASRRVGRVRTAELSAQVATQSLAINELTAVTSRDQTTTSLTKTSHRLVENSQFRSPALDPDLVDSAIADLTGDRS
jgi:hypothetical protein